MERCYAEIITGNQPYKIGDIIYDNGRVMVYDGTQLIPTLVGRVKTFHLIPNSVTKHIAHPTEFYFECITNGFYGNKILEIELHHETHKDLIKRVGFKVNPDYRYAINYGAMEIYCNDYENSFKFDYDHPGYDKDLHALILSEHVKTSDGLSYAILRKAETLNVLFRCDDIPFREYTEISFEDFLRFHNAIKNSGSRYSKEIDNLLQTIKLMDFCCIVVYSSYNFYENYACAGEFIDPDEFW